MKVVRGRSTSLRSRCSPVSSAKQVMWPLFHFSNVVRSLRSGTPQFVCLKSSEKFTNRTREDESLFTMTMRALTHRFSTLLTGQNVELMAQPPCRPDLARNGFSLFPHIKKKNIFFKIFFIAGCSLLWCKR